MAYIVPSDISQLALSGAHSGELETLALLKRELPPAYTVFHGMHWSRDQPSTNAFGEIDFVVLNGEGGALLIEQKNGDLDETNEGLVKQYDTGPKNVTDQIGRSLALVRDKFARQAGPRAKAKLDLEYLIYCPDHRLRSVLGTHLDRSRVIDAANRVLLPRRIQELLPVTKVVAEHATALDAFFRQTLDIVPDIHARLGAQERAFTRLAGGLVEVLANLEMSPLRLRIRGTAGCGKSLVARHFYGQAVAEGRRALLVCYNRPLADRLAAGAPPGGTVNTWHGLARAFLEDRGRQLDFAAEGKDPLFWRKLIELVLEEPIPPQWLFDTIIVDEGQDFEQEWWEVLQLFARKGADFLWLEDQSQNLFGKPPIELTGFVGYRAADNFRSPASIASFIERNLPIPFRGANPLPGLTVGISRWKAKTDQAALIATLIGQRVRQGFDLDDIIVLTTSGLESSPLSKLRKFGNYTVSRFDRFDERGNAIMRPGQVRFESVYRFKGQQAPAVILADIDYDPSVIPPERLERAQRVLFCGMTRATVGLDLVCSAGTKLDP